MYRIRRVGHGNDVERGALDAVKVVGNGDARVG